MGDQKTDGPCGCNIYPAIRGTVLYTACRYGGAKVVNTVRDMWNKTSGSDAELKRDRQGAWCRVKDKELILDAIKYMKKNVKTSNQYLCYAHLASTPLGRECVWNDIKTDW